MEFYEDFEDAARASKTKRVLIDTQGRVGMILDQLPVGLLIQHEQGILFANEAACEFLGASAEALVGQHILDYLSPDHAEKTAPILRNAFFSSKKSKATHVTIRPVGTSKRAISVTASRLPWEGTPVIQILLDDITEQLEHEQQMRAIMATDPLTGAQNRRSFMAYAHAVKEQNTTGSCGLILWDIDFFKHVNDTYGHPIGDIALQTLTIAAEVPIARRTLIDKPDIARAMLARVGGEEFAILLPGADHNETLEFAETLRRDIAEKVIVTRELEFSLTISIGVVAGDLAISSIDSLLSLADKAMYAAKRNGRNRVVSANFGMPRPPKGKRISRGVNRKQEVD
ncbi:MAG: diguanylate cyclase [Kordiimonadaceae bacterium]|nr:diguanylate cyclase [Kordiimonadaceae bacterium]